MLPWLSLSAVCLLFCQLNVYFFVSWLFTFLSADCLLLSAVCLQFDFSRQNHVFSSVFCQNDVFKLEMSADCLHFQLFVYIFSCLFTFSAVCLLFVSWLFTFSAVCLLLSAVCLLCQLISAICLLFVSWFQLFVYFLSAEISCLFTFCQLIVYNLNFRVKNLVFPWLFCHYRCFNTLIVNEKKIQFSAIFQLFQLFSNFGRFFQEFLDIWTFFHEFIGIFQSFWVPEKKNGHDSSLYSRKSFNYGACDVDYSINTK